MEYFEELKEIFGMQEVNAQVLQSSYQSFVSKFSKFAMNELVANLHENVNSSITVYGEPWTGGTIALSGTAASQNNLHRFEGFGQFNDKMRDSLIKGAET